ncbi:hypothetical protein [Catellatospora paridis]|uniref:hypothetical protein n=1 Tax=Catellatospora paridis TaxID=1617086 RepID=UPI0012D397A4|nr:hypothetical protein [Catellatospora paridis]
MKELETETLVRDTFRHHEHLVSGRAPGLVVAVRARADRRRRTMRAVGVAVAVFAVLGGAVVGVAATGGGRHADPAPVAGPDTTGWRWESWLGAQVMVPGDWTQEDFGCLGTNAPSVARFPRSEHTCGWTEPVDKEVALLGTGTEGDTKPQMRPVTIDGVPALRGDFRLPDGRYAGAIEVPSRRLGLTVRTMNAAKTEHILGSFRLVDVDHAGCPTLRPVREPSVVDSLSTGPFVPPYPASIAICVYHTGFGNEQVEGRLRRSMALAGVDAVRLADRLNAAEPGANPDPPARVCTQEGPVIADAMLIVRSGTTTTRVWAIFSSCTGRGLDNGARRAQLTMGIVWQIMQETGFSMRAPFSE